MTQVSVSPKFQIVIPKEARQELKVKVGQKVTCLVKGGILYVVPVKPISQLRGILPYNKEAFSDLREKKDRGL